MRSTDDVADTRASRMHDLLWQLPTIVVVSFIALICAKGVDQACHRAEPPVQIPEPGTPRGRYCIALEHTSLIPTLVIGPILATVLVMLVLRNRPRLLMSMVVVIVIATIGNVVVAHLLEHSSTL